MACWGNEKDKLSAFDGWAIFELGERVRNRSKLEKPAVSIHTIDSLEKKVALKEINRLRAELDKVNKKLAKGIKELNDLL